MRLDQWLDIACLFKTRSEAQKACRGGTVDVGGQAAKPHRDIRVGEVIEISRPYGRRQQVIVRALAERHVAKAAAREFTRMSRRRQLPKRWSSVGWPG